MSELIFKKAVDFSLLKYGTTVPKNIHNHLLNALGVTLHKGQSYTVQTIINNIKYDAFLTMVNYSADVSDREVIQIRYSEGSALCQKLREVFANTVARLFSSDEADRKASSIPDEEKEYIEIYVVDSQTLEFKCYPKEKSMKTEFFKYLGGPQDLSGYQRSYKLVFYKNFFERISEDGEVAAAVVTTAFQQYYINRKQAGRG